VILGVAAHITAAAANGPRYNRRLTPAQRRSFANGIWLCVFHGTHVDHDHTRYTVNQLRKWKRDAEARAHRELESAGGRSARPRLTNVVRARPRILYARQKGSAVHQGKGGPYLYFVSQLWFQNEPTKGSAIARSLTARLTFIRNEVPVFPEMHGEWAIANAADNLGFTGTRETWTELLPVGDYAKLMILQKRVEEDEAYAWSKGATEYPGRRHPAHRIPPGEYELRVHIRGLDINETFRFRLVNPGAGGNPAIQPI
jgi:hypothetical protein